MEKAQNSKLNSMHFGVQKVAALVKSKRTRKPRQKMNELLLDISAVSFIHTVA